MYMLSQRYKLRPVYQCHRIHCLAVQLNSRVQGVRRISEDYIYRPDRHLDIKYSNESVMKITDIETGEFKFDPTKFKILLISVCVAIDSTAQSSHISNCASLIFMKRI